VLVVAQRPDRDGGTASVGVSTASYGASDSSAAAACRRIAPIARPNSGPLVARPRSPSHRVSGRSRCSRPGGAGESAVSTAQQTSKKGTASRPIGTGMSSTSCPSCSSSREVSSQARRTSGSTDASVMTGSTKRAMRSRPGSRSAAARKVLGSGGAKYGSPGRRTASTSSSAAASRTVRAIGPAVARPTGSPYIGAPLTRPRDGLNPTSPQHDAGMRIDPPPSEPWASGTSPAATAAAAPPEEPPAVRVGSHGVTLGGRPSGSV
jgi:hypothetical protein